MTAHGPEDRGFGHSFTREDMVALHQLIERYPKLERMIEKDDAVRWLAAFTRNFAAWIVGIVAAIAGIIYLLTGRHP